MPQHINLMKAFKPSSLLWPSSRFGTCWVIAVSPLLPGASLASQRGWQAPCPLAAAGTGRGRVREASAETTECFSPPSLCPVRRAEARYDPAPACNPHPQGCGTTGFCHDQGYSLAGRGSAVAWVPGCRQRRTPEA